MLIIIIAYIIHKFKRFLKFFINKIHNLPWLIFGYELPGYYNWIK